jgi:Ni/Co efflux regulator RcnB
MKKILILAVTAVTLLSACKTSQLASSDDDVYVNPREEKEKQKLAAEEKAKERALARQKEDEERAAQKAKDDANPYYKDPEYNRDDYYDYEYASRVNRFQNPIYGASYYDPYYTNLYTYNQNPSCYGTSIYSTYNYGMPSSQ